ncbi:lytic murein transglycosylase B [Polynucleobacter victoriensis]|uniref:Membrane-bound lytic murein transglycosylase B n=1 Tax=Polynucleobacter victoriensis TaxID=2049319 RepID=A0A212T4Q9_9BURK|nr:lytic murein transglycosylase B [Polynucleobacter victoriensis]SNC61028.1 membrane-bound lytic murein transglycosylase B [Polynucleobacter victoriensis]
MKPLALAQLGLVCGITTFVLSACSTLPSKQAEQKSDSNQVINNDNFAELEKKPDSLAPFLEKVSQDHQIPLKDLQLAFDDAKTIPSIKKLVMPPPVGFQKNWKVYRSRFVEPKRLAAGQQFWKKHRTFIEATANKTGVPAEVIVSIIGVETIYGKHMGGFSVRDTLITLGFDYPNTPNKTSREALFKNQLEDLILLCRTENPQASLFKKCLNQLGSYAGAIGLPQFMPGSIRRFAVDGNNDGRIDLRNSPEDAIASVANFLKAHGWVTGEPIYLDIQNNEEAMILAKKLADGEPKAKLKLGDLAKDQMISKTELPDTTPSLVVDLPSPDSNGGTEVKYVVGLRNFIAICDYNRSFFYAQSVAEFAQALRGEVPGQEVTAKKSSEKTKKTSKKSSKKSTKVKQASN